MDLRSQKRLSFLAQPNGASTTSLQRSHTQRSQVSATLPSSTVRPPQDMCKLVVIGDGGCGKTSMLTRYLLGKFPENYVPTVFETDTKEVSWRGRNVELALWDTAGQEEYDRLRSLSYPETDVVLLCYSIDAPVSLENIRDRWLPEARLYCPGIPFILIGLKYDVRKSKTPTLSTEDGASLAREEGLSGFLECSAQSGHNINVVFEAAMDRWLGIKAEWSPGALAAQEAFSNSHPSNDLPAKEPGNSPTAAVRTPFASQPSAVPPVKEQPAPPAPIRRRRRRHKLHCIIS